MKRGRGKGSPRPNVSSERAVAQKRVPSERAGYAPDRERRKRGILSMLDLPLVDREDGIPEVDVLLLGVPTDAATLYRTGARLGPNAVRQVSWMGGRFSSALGIDIYDELRVADGGNVSVEDLTLETSLPRIAERVAAIARSGAVAGIVGGDQSATLAALRGIRTAKKRAVGLIHIDAFHDALPERVKDRFGIHHRNVIRHAVSEGLIRLDSAMQVGVRGPCDSASEQAFALGQGFEVVSMDEVRWDFHAVVSQVRNLVSRGSLYVSIDLCALDPSVAPGVSTPAPGGMSSWQLQQLLRALVGADIVGFDVVELCPVYDTGQLAAGIATITVQEVLSAIADTRRSARPAKSRSSIRGRRGRRSA
jgi:arginase family enzyme